MLAFVEDWLPGNGAMICWVGGTNMPRSESHRVSENARGCVALFVVVVDVWRR